MLHYFALYKPFEVLTQFSSEGNKKTLKDIIDVPTDVYPVGRLDYDSEGLLLLTNDKGVNAALLQPSKRREKSYFVQLEGEITPDAISELKKGVNISINNKLHHTLPAKVISLSKAPSLPERNPPIRFRKNIPTSWISLSIREGKNRQVRKMTASVGFPTLRLVRYRIGGMNIEGWYPGELRSFTREEFYKLVFNG
ncbi:pseudouridine synthase [Flavihumibacter sp. ZG627]|uniref:pseudouridine synthase n=1 Tax=Flavihumibacter sp. ZG627 TaxID=1463156 RepID=UPI00057D254D|nr:pseudouridine synthase [Flavihumibacter sp. ZG627]KIC92160.1 pseudouridine synthase [Flavihumibacter sp. ZG627]